MSKIAVYHPVFGHGGAESVCMHVLEALQEDHEVTLVSMTEVDLVAQNEYFDTNVNPNIGITRLGEVGKVLERSMSVLDRTLSNRFGRLHAALFSRHARDMPEFDLIFSTSGELVTERPSIQYIHYPWYNRTQLPEHLRSQSTIEQTYDRVCQVLSAHDTDNLAAHRLLTNSNWTADLLQELYCVDVETIYPPVVTGKIDPKPWKDRDRGFVCVGRLDPSKNIHQNIEIVDQLRNRAHDVHLHIIGPAEDQEYSRRIERLADDRPYIFLEGRTSRERLIELLCAHRYGIHGMENEHFGIAVAELVAAGTIPFVPDSGGQVEIVQELDILTYNSVTDAVEKADTVLSNQDIQRSIRDSFPDIEKQFGPERFKQEIRTVVDETLSS